MYKTFGATQEDMHEIFELNNADMKAQVELRLFVMHYLLNLHEDKTEIELMLSFLYKNYPLLAEQFKKNYTEGKNDKIFSMPRRGNASH